MRSVNKVIIIGNLTRDPEMRQTPNGQNIVTFGLATNREWVTSTGERKASAEFHECVAWAKLAEICEKYLRKGKLIYVEGYLKTRSWDTEEGIRKFKTEIVVEDMIMLNKKSEGDDDYVPSTDFSSDDSTSEKPAVEEEKPAEEEAPAEEEKPAEQTQEDEVDPVSSEAEAEPTKKDAEEPEAEGESPIDKDLGL